MYAKQRTNFISLGAAFLNGRDTSLEMFRPAAEEKDEKKCGRLLRYAAIALICIELVLFIPEIAVDFTVFPPRKNWHKDGGLFSTTMEEIVEASKGGPVTWIFSAIVILILDFSALKGIRHRKRRYLLPYVAIHLLGAIFTPILIILSLLLGYFGYAAYLLLDESLYCASVVVVWKYYKLLSILTPSPTVILQQNEDLMVQYPSGYTPVPSQQPTFLKQDYSLRYADLSESRFGGSSEKDSPDNRYSDAIAQA